MHLRTGASGCQLVIPASPFCEMLGPSPWCDPFQYIIWFQLALVVLLEERLSVVHAEVDECADFCGCHWHLLLFASEEYVGHLATCYKEVEY